MESWFLTEVEDRYGNKKPGGGFRHNLTTDTASGYTNRRDWQSKAMGLSDTDADYVGAATATSATSLTNSGASFATAGQGLSGRIVVASSDAGSTVYGMIVSNTGTVLTVDKWYNPGTHATGTTPAATSDYCILPGQLPAAFIAVGGTDTTPAATDTTLSGELSTDGFARALATFAHTAAATTYTLQVVFTSTGGTHTIYETSVVGSGVLDKGVMPFESDVPNPPPLVSGDILTETVTVTVN